MLREGLKSSSNVDGASDNREIQPSPRSDISIHDISQMYADAIAQNVDTPLFILGVYPGDFRLRLLDSSNQPQASIVLTKRKNRKKTVSHKLQNFATMTFDRFTCRVEEAVEQIDYFIPRSAV
ncbi:hypothetical protein D3C80_860350 [compost metagenome]